MRTLYCDTGHSVRFPGAKGFRNESLWNRVVLGQLLPLLDKTKWNPVIVPDAYKSDILGSSNLNLINRIRFINKACHDGDWVLSLHGNGAINPAVRGVTTCFMGESVYMRRKAVELSKWYSSTTGVPLWNGGAFDDRMGRFGQIGMVRDTKPPALLIEMGFVTNKLDMDVEPLQAAKGISMFFNQL